MNKKRFFSAIAATALAAVTGISLVACGDKTNNEDGKKPEGTQPATLTKEQWDAAFDIGNFLKDARIDLKQTAGTEASESTLRLGSAECSSYSTEFEFKKDGVKEYGGTTIVIVGEETTDNYYKEDDEWNYSMIDKHDYAANDYKLWIEYALSAVQYNYLTKISEAYASFGGTKTQLTYSGNGLILASEHEEDEDVYYDSSITATAVTVTLSDGKLSAISMTCKYSVKYVNPEADIDESQNTDMTVSYTFSYGAQTVEAPAGVKPSQN